MTKLERAARVAVRDCMGVKRGETVLVITDEPLREIGYLLWREAKRFTSEAILTEIIPRKSSGQEPPPAVASLMKQVQAILIPTSKSLSHTNARRQACKDGARVATLPGITAEIMERTLNANYKKIAEKSRKLADILTIGHEIRLTTPAGTDIVMSIDKVKGKADTGLVHQPGNFSNLPAGEACLAPVEGKSEGVVIVDGAIANSGKLRNPIRMIVRGGFVTKIFGEKEAQCIRNLIKPFGKKARNIAEIGIGTNDKARLCGNILEDEKVIGTVHIALGDNVSLGGTVSVPIHVDGILLKPTLIIDGRKILERGKFLV